MVHRGGVGNFALAASNPARNNFTGPDDATPNPYQRTTAHAGTGVLPNQSSFIGGNRNTAISIGNGSFAAARGGNRQLARVFGNRSVAAAINNGSPHRVTVRNNDDFGIAAFND